VWFYGRAAKLVVFFLAFLVSFGGGRGKGRTLPTTVTTVVVMMMNFVAVAVLAGSPPLYRQQDVGAVHTTVNAHMPVQVTGLGEPK